MSNNKISNLENILAQFQTHKKFTFEYLSELNNICGELFLMIESCKRYPEIEDFYQQKKFHLLIAIEKIHGGYDKVKSIVLGKYPDMNKENAIIVKSKKARCNSHEKEMNVIAKLHEVTNVIGRFPTDSDIKRLKLHNLRYNIYHYTAGLNHLRQEMGYTLARKSPNYYGDIRNIRNEIDNLRYLLNGRFPRPVDFIKHKKKTLLNKIYMYFENLDKLRELSNY